MPAGILEGKSTVQGIFFSFFNSSFLFVITSSAWQDKMQILTFFVHFFEQHFCHPHFVNNFLSTLLRNIFVHQHLFPPHGDNIFSTHIIYHFFTHLDQVFFELCEDHLHLCAPKVPCFQCGKELFIACKIGKNLGIDKSRLPKILNNQ